MIQFLPGDKADPVWLYEMVGWLILASGMEVVKFFFSNIPMRAPTMKDPTHPWGGSLVRGTPPLDPNPDGPVLGPDGQGESSMMVGPLYAMSHIRVETPSSPQEYPSIFHEVLNEFCPGEQLDSEPLSRSGSLVDYTFEESELGKMPKGDPLRLSGTMAYEFPMRLAVKGEACVSALSDNPVNIGRVGWENAPSDDSGRDTHPTHPHCQQEPLPWLPAAPALW